MKPECHNQHIKIQCSMLLSSLETFEHGIQLAAKKDDGKIDTAERYILNDITKDLIKLKKKLNKYI